MTLGDQTGLEYDWTVSVAIPTPNRAEICLRAVASALQQTAPPAGSDRLRRSIDRRNS